MRWFLAGMAALDGLIADCLGEMAFAGTGRTQEQNILCLTDEFTTGKIIYLFLLEGMIKLPVKIFQGFHISKTRLFEPSLDQPCMLRSKSSHEKQYGNFWCGAGFGRVVLVHFGAMGVFVEKTKKAINHK